MAYCPHCGGAIGRDCFNVEECGAITADITARSGDDDCIATLESENDSLRKKVEELTGALSTLQGAEQKPVAVLHRKEGLGPYIETLDEAWKIGTGRFDLFAAPAALKSAERQP